MTTQQRAEILAQAFTPFTEFLGKFTAQDLIDWITLELHHPEILDNFVPYGTIKTKANPAPHILHILSGNTPHAALQTTLRGLLVGANNTLKLPSNGIPEITALHQSLPQELQEKLHLTNKLDLKTLHTADTVITFGSDQTIQKIQSKLLPHQTHIQHGHKISIGIIDKPTRKAAALAAKDIASFNQQGCLSLQNIFVLEEPKEFAKLLAEAMASYQTKNPRPEITLSEAGAISNLRETIRYQAASDPENHTLYESTRSTDWTVIYQSDPTITPTPLNRTIYVKPWPENPIDLGSETKHLSTIALRPLGELIHLTDSLKPPRICKLGKGQNPPLTWHHDTLPPLASLVTYQDIH